MPRSKLQNVTRRGAVYWWSRTFFPPPLVQGNPRPISFKLSLFTKDLGTARRRAAEMTAFSERLRVNMMFRIGSDGIDESSLRQIFQTEMRAFRDWLTEEEAVSKAGSFDPSGSWADAFRLLGKVWDHIEMDGCGLLRTGKVGHLKFSAHSQELQSEISSIVSDHTDDGRDNETRAISYIKYLQLDNTTQSRAMAMKEIVSARAAAAREFISENFD